MRVSCIFPRTSRIQRRLFPGGVQICESLAGLLGYWMELTHNPGSEENNGQPVESRLHNSFPVAAVNKQLSPQSPFPDSIVKQTSRIKAAPALFWETVCPMAFWWLPTMASKHIIACRHIIAISASISTLLSSLWLFSVFCYKDPCVGFGVHPNLRLCTLRFILYFHLQSPFFLTMSGSEVLSRYWLWGAITQSTTTSEILDCHLPLTHFLVLFVVSEGRGW